jgi:NADH-quinone oxidoreductase subunit J
VMAFRSRGLRATGGALAALGMLILEAGLPFLGDWTVQGVFWLLAGVTSLSAVAVVAARSPVYSAIWFALTLLGTAGILLVQGAQFLGVATIVVYAGAILVTFLFVLMLAQPETQAFYDRISWGRLPVGLASLTGGLIVAGVAHLAGAAWHDEHAPPGRAVLSVAAAESGVVVGDRAAGVLQPRHVSALGAELFGRQLISVQVAAALLLAALVGSVAVAIHGRHYTAGRGEQANG